MKNTKEKTRLMSLMMLGMLTSTMQANFNFNECAGAGTFEQEIVHYAGDYEKSTLVGEIPAGIEGLEISLTSDKDVDIRLYGANNDKIVHWPYGIHNQSNEKTKAYMNVPILYSGYNGIAGEKGHELIKVEGTTPTAMRMKAFGYKAGYATVNYSWTGKVGCDSETSGEGSFTQTLEQNATSLVGTIPPGVANVYIALQSDKDLDIQLFAKDGTAIASWKPAGLMAADEKQTVLYHDMNITWSGYNGVNGQKGYEYISIIGKTSEMLVMKVFGYEAGVADVSYTWGEAKEIEAKITSNSKSYTSMEPIEITVSGIVNPDNQDWVGIYPHDASNDWDHVLQWRYTNGTKDASKAGVTDAMLAFDALPIGSYEARLFYKNSFDLESKIAFVVEDDVMEYGKGGTHPVGHYDEVDNGMTTVYYPTDIPEGTKVPLVFFASGYGSQHASDYESLLTFIASRGYYVMYAKHAWDHVFENMDKMLDDKNGILSKIDTSRIAVLGHSLGGGYTFNILKHFSDMGYGENGRFVMVLEGYFAYNLNKAQMQHLPSNTNVVMQQYGLGGNNAVNDTDPRITLTEFYLLDSIDKSKKDWQIVEDADHRYPYGSGAYTTMQGILKPLDALMEYTFNGTQSAHDIALEQGSDDPYNHGNGMQVVNPIESYTYKCNSDAEVTIDYCDMTQWYTEASKQLILNQKGHWLPTMADNFAAKADYINSLPFSGFTMVGNSYTNRVMEPNAPLLSYAYIWDEVKAVKGLYPHKSNFLKINMHYPADYWDDGVWNNVINNFKTVAKVAKDLGFRGIIYDDEPYDTLSHNMINYKHGDSWYDKKAYKNPDHTFVEHSDKITQRFTQIMQAMVSVYPTIDVLFYHSPVEGHKEANSGIDGHPVVVHVGLERQHEWTGAMFTGLKKGLGAMAGLHDMGEDYRLRTQKHFDDAYAWRKHTIASDTTNDAVDNTQHWIVPEEERASWGNDVHVDFMVSNEPLSSDTYPQFDTTNSVGIDDIKTTLERALEKSDKYVVFYSASSSDNQGGNIQLDWLNSPNTHQDNGQAYGLNNDWKEMLEEVYHTKVAQ